MFFFSSCMKFYFRIQAKKRNTTTINIYLYFFCVNCPDHIFLNFFKHIETYSSVSPVVISSDNFHLFFMPTFYLYLERVSLMKRES